MTCFEGALDKTNDVNSVLRGGGGLKAVSLNRFVNPIPPLEGHEGGSEGGHWKCVESREVRTNAMESWKLRNELVAKIRYTTTIVLKKNQIPT